MLPFGSLRKLTERLSRIVGCRPREDSILCPALFSSAVMVNILSGDHNSSGVADWFERSRETVALSLTLAGKLDWPFKFWAVQVFAANFVRTPETIEVGVQVQPLYPACTENSSHHVLLLRWVIPQQTRQDAVPDRAILRSP
jgi:hypothetical protein